MISDFEEFKKNAIEQHLLDELDFKIIAFLDKNVPSHLYTPFNFVISCLQYSVQQGSLCISLQSENLAIRLSSMIKLVSDQIIPLSTFSSIVHDFTSALKAGNFASVIGTERDFLPLIEMNGNLYFQKHQSAEAKVGNKIVEFLKETSSNFSHANFSAIFDMILNTHPIRISNSTSSIPMHFSSKQIEALGLALKNKLTIINGGPGTGKTSIATNILRAWTRAWHGINKTLPKISLVAPTGRAAQKLADSLRVNINSILYQLDPENDKDGAIESIENFSVNSVEKSLDQFIATLNCESLHSLLKYNPGTGRFFYGGENTLSADLIIVDEVSMVDVFLLSQLLDALKKNTCLIFLGDMDQLPSVDSGSVLADLLSGINANSPMLITHPLRNSIITLEKNHRSNSSILKVADRINAMDATGATQLIEASPEFFQWPALDGSGKYQAQFSEQIDNWIQARYLSILPGSVINADSIVPLQFTLSYEKIVAELSSLSSSTSESFFKLLGDLFKQLDQSRILTFTRSGWYGCVSINKMIAEKLSKSWDKNYSKNITEGFHGSPILILENQSTLKLYNGDVGILLFTAGSLQAFFQKGAEFISFPIHSLPRFELAFASTIHKSQGSEFNQVFLVLPEAGNRLLFKETLYTAITRAKSFVRIYGAEKVFHEAVSKRIIRESGLLEYIKTKMV